MSSVVDVLISSARSVGRSGNPPAFLSFARGASTAAVSLPPLFPPSVGSSPSRSDDDVCRLCSQLFTPPSHGFIHLFIIFRSCLSFFPIGCAKWPPISALATATSHCHFQMAHGTRFRRACQYGCVRVVPRVTRAAALLSRVSIWLPYGRNLTRGFLSNVTSFQTEFY